MEHNSNHQEESENSVNDALTKVVTKIKAIFDSKPVSYLIGIFCLVLSSASSYSAWQEVRLHGFGNLILLIIEVVTAIYVGAMGLGAFGFYGVSVYIGFSIFWLGILTLLIWLLSWIPVGAAIILGAILMGSVIVIGLRR